MNQTIPFGSFAAYPACPKNETASAARTFFRQAQKARVITRPPTRVNQPRLQGSSVSFLIIIVILAKRLGVGQSSAATNPSLFCCLRDLRVLRGGFCVVQVVDPEIVSRYLQITRKHQKP